MSQFRIGIIGSGFMGLTHAAAVDATDGCTLVAISGGRRAPGLAAQHGVEHIEDPSSLIERTDFDAIIVTTPHHLHVRDTLHAFDTGKHVLVEKPMATSVADCDAMIDAASAAGKVLAVGFQQRFRKNNREAKRLIEAGALGDLMLAHVAMLPSMQPMLADPGFAGGWAWWRDPRSLGHVINAGPHAVDLLRWAFGVEVQTVSALCRTFQRDAHVEDTTAALLALSNGAVCSFNSSLMAPAPSFPGEEFRFRFIGANSVMDLDPYSELRISNAGKLETVSTQETLGHQSSNTLTNPVRMAAYNRQMAEFVRAMSGEASEIATGQDGRASVAACLAMLESSSTGSVVRLS